MANLLQATQTSDASVPTHTEVPPELSFEIAWADETTTREIMAMMRDKRRQTMNLRLMKTARLIVLRTWTARSIIGWAGLDCGYTPGRAEIFSLFLDEAFRAYTLHSVLDLTRSAYLLKQGVTHAYTRIEMTTNRDWSKKRQEMGTHTHVPIEELPSEYVSLCHKCELFQHECTEQAYFRVDLQKLNEVCANRLQRAIDPDSLPIRFDLNPEILRRKIRPGGAPPGPGEGDGAPL